ncbi:unnamed protein product [Owenia fusiformis]|uniref:Uncharacterized protein n=1 Tax=Owenia fusiformis TaxID=6347 RepID=A0A8J1U1F8_OWEFU|nr:unnamed protein product [Owenia fusiformis]
MSSFHQKIKDQKLDSLHKVIDNGTNKYLFFTKFLDQHQSWILCVSDGIELWRLEVDDQELDTRRDVLELSSIDSYLTKFRTAYQSGDIQISQQGFSVSLTIGQGAKSFDFKLYEAKAAEKKLDVQDILFRLAEVSIDLDKKLTQAEKTIDTLRSEQGKNSSKHTGYFADQEKDVVSKTKVRPRQVGMSVINPSSKKRKVAQGMVFEDSDEDQ